MWLRGQQLNDHKSPGVHPRIETGKEGGDEPRPHLDLQRFDSDPSRPNLLWQRSAARPHLRHIGGGLFLHPTGHAHPVRHPALQ
jgi:hypothetical protein